MKYSSLLGDVAGFAKRVAERPVEIQKTRRASRKRYLFHERQSYSRYTLRFDFLGEQSHGPRADGSSRDQQGQINIRLADAPRGFFDRRHEQLGAPH